MFDCIHRKAARAHPKEIYTGRQDEPSIRKPMSWGGSSDLQRGERKVTKIALKS